MTILKKDRINRFRDRLYQKKMPRLFKAGSEGLRPIKRSKTNEQGNIIIPTKEIINFFQTSVTSGAFIDADQYFSNLYLLFSILAKDSSHYTFESDVQISVADINKATNKKAIEYLTSNLIISFFDNVHLSDGSDSDPVLQKDLKQVIKTANEGRDYKNLVSNTLQTMVQTLKKDKPWRESLDDIQTAALVCRLVGAKLPQIDKDVLSKNIVQARSEIKQDLALFNKILNTKTELIKAETDQKKLFKTMKKLDTATSGVLKKIDTFLSYAHTFISAIGSSSQDFLDTSDALLKNCIARFFFEFRTTEAAPPQSTSVLNYSTTRYRMGILFDYPELTRFTTGLKQEEKYAPCFDDLFGLFFNEIIKQTERLSVAETMNTRNLESCLGETLRLVDTFGLKKEDMASEKKSIKKQFLSLVRSTSHEQLPAILALKEKILRVIQDDDKELLEDVRKVLVDNCFANLTGLDIETTSADELNKTVRKLILSYSIYYKPQRFFYHNFFTQYVGNADEETLTKEFSDISRSKKRLAVSILSLFSDVNHVGDLLSAKQIEHADSLLARLH